LGCKGSAQPNRAQHVLDGRQVEFPALGKTWGHGAGRLVDLSTRRNLLLGEGVEKLLPLSTRPHAPMTTDGDTLLLSSPGKLEWMRIGSRERQEVPGAKPAPWYAPAISGDFIAWVQRGEEDTGEDIWSFSISEGKAKPLAQSPAHERHVVVDGDWVAWLTDNTIHLLDGKSGAHQRFEGQFNSNEGLGLSDGLLCWEARIEGDLDIHCSDGLHLKRPGDQRRPSLWRGWLLFHEGEDALLYGPLK
jgi:hypothetical protein